MNRTKSFVAVIVTAAGLATTAASAAPLNFTFSFVNFDNGDGTVTGIVRGLVDDTSDQAATSVEILSNTSGFGIGEFIGVPVYNLWSVSDGSIVDMNFSAFGRFNNAPAVTDSSLIFEWNSINGMSAGLTNDGFSVSYRTGGFAPLEEFFVGQDLAPIPLPAGGLLLLTGLAAAAGLGYRKKLAA